MEIPIEFHNILKYMFIFFTKGSVSAMWDSERILNSVE